jgi:hypothetical protein
LSYLVDEDANHVSLGSFQGSEPTTEVELYIVFFALHTDAKQYATLAVQVHPKIMSQEVAELFWVQAQVRSANSIMLPNERTISDAYH